MLKSNYTAAIIVAAYSYMALVPIVQPFCIRLITTKKERMIRMEYTPGKITKTTRILFPIVVTVIAGIVSPQSVALVGFLMFGNLLRECGVLNALSETSRVIAKMAKEEDPYNFILMQAAGANVAGQVASVIAGGIILALVGPLV